MDEQYCQDLIDDGRIFNCKRHHLPQFRQLQHFEGELMNPARHINSFRFRKQFFRITYAAKACALQHGSNLVARFCGPKTESSGSFASRFCELKVTSNSNNSSKAPSDACKPSSLSRCPRQQASPSLSSRSECTADPEAPIQLDKFRFNTHKQTASDLVSFSGCLLRGWFSGCTTGAICASLPWWGVNPPGSI